MKVTVLRENATQKDDWFKVGEFSDLHHPIVFAKAVLAEAEEQGYPVRLSIELNPEEPV